MGQVFGGTGGGACTMCGGFAPNCHCFAPDMGTCKRCGASMHKVRIEHWSAIKGDDNWSDLTACSNERCPDYVKG